MSLIEEIRKTHITCRILARGSEGHKLQASLLTTLIGEAERVGKDAGDRAPTDDEVLTVIRKFLKNVDETLKVRPNDFTAVQEREILAAYLPQPLSDEELRQFLTKTYAADQISVKNMKNLLADLDAAYPGRASGLQLATILRQGT